MVTDSYKFEMIKAMFLLAFHGLLRIGEFTVKKNEHNHTLQMADIQFGQNTISKGYSCVIITFRYFKQSKVHPVVLHTFIHFKPRGFYDTSVLAIQFTIETLLCRATLNGSTPLPQVVAARCPDSH